jgi:signal peptide peptidase SppA
MDSKKHNALQLLTFLTRSQLWAILPDRLAGLMAGGYMSDWEAAKPSIKGTGNNRVAVIPVQGVLTKDGPSWLGSNYDGITNAVEQAGADSTVKHVVLAVDSPGGEVIGLPETAAALASVAKVKPVSALVEGMSASAAYWLTSQASDIALTPSGEVGSVGVRMMHMDISKMLDDIGVKPTEISSGSYKTEWSPYKPLTEEAIADMQGRLDAVHTEFLTAVTIGRGMRASQEMRESRFGEGRMMSASVALGHGLVDSLASPREFYKTLTPAPEVEDASPQYGLPRRARLERARFS